MRLQLFLLFGLVAACSAASDRVPVTTATGPVLGSTHTVDGRTISRFLAIPYAKPPVGSLRFRQSVPADAWTEPLEALDWPPACIQWPANPMGAITNRHDLALAKNISEDCLYVNVWTPAVGKSDDLKPVIVWIHGGGLFFGTSAFDVFDGEMLAAKADAVVFSFNYRLSTLGFLYSDEVPEISGNQGLRDQQAAIAWIKANAQAFGGNPNQITIMGESAGGWSVGLHILSPASRNLFQNAIQQSGATTGEMTILSPKEHVARFLVGIRKVGCAGEEDKTISKKVVECLEQLNAFQVDQVFYQSFQDPFEPLIPLVVIDGEFLPASPAELFASGNYKTDVNLIASTVEDEGSFILAMYADKVPSLRPHNPEPFTLAQAKQFLADLLENHYFKSHSIQSDLINKLYFNGLNEGLDSQNEFRKRTGVALGDLVIGCPTIDFARSVFKNAPTSAKVYQLFYKAKLGADKFLCHGWAGACHCDDLYSVFGVPFRRPEEHLNRERDISQELINVIASFARTGTPGPEQPEWEPYFLSPNGKEVVAPYYEIGNDYKTPASFKFNLKQLECELLWNKLNAAKIFPQNLSKAPAQGHTEL